MRCVAYATVGTSEMPKAETRGFVTLEPNLGVTDDLDEAHNFSSIEDCTQFINAMEMGEDEWIIQAHPMIVVGKKG